MTSSTAKLTKQSSTITQSSNGAGVSTPKDKLKQRARDLRKSGKTFREIAQELKISHEWARTLCNGEERGKQVQVIFSKIDPEEEALKLLAQDFGEHCNRLRTRMKLTQMSFGKLMAVNGNPGLAVSRWESGKHIPQRKFLLRFMEIQRQFDNRKTKRKWVV